MYFYQTGDRFDGIKRENVGSYSEKGNGQTMLKKGQEHITMLTARNLLVS